MKQFLLGAIIYLSLTTTYAQDTGKDYIRLIAQSVSYVNQHSDKVWPGFSITTPITIYLYDLEQTYSINIHPKNPHWQKLELGNLFAYFLDKDDYGFSKLSSPDIYLMETETEIDDQPTSLTIYNLKKLQEFERFDAVDIVVQQIAKKFYPSIPDKFTLKSYTGFNQLQNVKLFYLELAALKEYLFHDNDEAAKFLQDAVAIHQYRSSLLDKDSLVYENDDEIFFGYPYYVGYKSLNDDTVFKTNFLSNIDSMCKLSDSALQNQDIIYSCLSWSRSIALGSLYSLAMDRKFNDGAWKQQAISQFKSAATLLQETYHLTLEEAKKQAQNAMQNPSYSFARIDRDIEQYLKSYLEEMNAELANYKNQSGIELQSNVRFSIGNMFDQPANTVDKIYAISTDDKLLKNVIWKIQTDKNDFLEYNDINLIYESFFRGDYYDHFKIEPDTQLIVDGHTYSVINFMAAKKKISFHQLQMNNAKLVINLVSTPGVLDGSGTALELSVTQDSLKSTARGMGILASKFFFEKSACFSHKAEGSTGF